MSYILFGRMSTSDFGFIVAPYEIPMPPARKDFVAIPGRDGSLDMTEASGYVRYGDRVIDLTLYAVGDYRQRLFEFTNLYHGQRYPVTFDKDPDYTYNGRIDVNGITKHDGYCEINVTVTADAYKLDGAETTITVNGSGRANLVNGRMPLVPTVKTTAEATLSWTVGLDTHSVTVSAGQHVLPHLALEPNGSMRVTVASLGTTTFSFRKGWL